MIQENLISDVQEGQTLNTYTDSIDFKQYHVLSGFVQKREQNRGQRQLNDYERCNLHEEPKCCIQKSCIY